MKCFIKSYLIDDDITLGSTKDGKTVDITSPVGKQLTNNANDLTSFGTPEVLEELEVPVPALTDTKVLIEMRASSINPADILFRSAAILQSPMADKFPAQFQLPLVLGNEVAGIVKEVDEKVRHFKPGYRVMGMVQRGSYMDYVAVEEDLLAVIPESLSFGRGRRRAYGCPDSLASAV
jgi:NADPH:quinone reductase-like Zn-dependent oxidoreductase